MKTIGIIIPVYNRPEVVLHTLDAIERQTYQNIVCVVVDDGSTDHTPERVRAWIDGNPADGDPARKGRFQLRARSCPGGPARARNEGIRLLWDRVEWFAFCDSDDIWRPGKLETQLSTVGEHKISHTEEIWIKNGKPHNPKRIHAKPVGRIFVQCLPLCCVSPSTVLIHKSVFEDVGLFDEQLWVCEDYELWLRIFCRYEIALCEEPLITKTGGHADQLSRRYVGMDRFRLYGLLKTYRDCRRYLSEQEQAALIDMIRRKSEILSKGYLKHTGSAYPYDQIYIDAQNKQMGRRVDVHIHALEHTMGSLI